MPSMYFSANDTITPGQFMMFPKELLTDKYSHISLDAKVLYTLLLDRVALSIKNNLIDTNGNVYIVCKQTEIQKLLGFAKQKVQKMFNELEDNLLIDRKRQGNTLPDLIFVKKLSTENVDNSVENSSHEGLNTTVTDENNTSCGMENNTSLGMKIMPVNNTNIINTELSDTKSIYQENIQPSKDSSSTNDGLISPANAREIVLAQIDHEAIAVNINDASVKLALSNIVSLMTAVYSQDYGKISVNSEQRKYVELRDRFMQLNQFHIEYVLECLSKRKDSAMPITNLKAYLATALYNAPVTMEDYYRQQVKYLQAQSAKANDDWLDTIIAL